MIFQNIEKHRLELSASLPNLFGKTKLFEISSFYSALLNTNDKNIIEAFSLDFIEDFFCELHLFTPFHQSPQKTELLLNLLNEIKTIPTLEYFENEFIEIINTISSSLNKLKEILEGQNSKPTNKALTFPLIEISNDTSNNEINGTLESVSIKINPTKHKNKFVFVPSDKKVEERLLNQAKISFKLAINYFHNRNHKFHEFHEILIYFENLYANYEGESLGVALTIGFIEQLSLLYNLPYITNIKNSVATTGGINESGQILSISKEIIKKKVEFVFFSGIEYFIIPKEDEVFARERLKQLQETYPNRKLNLIPIERITDITNRRDLVEIKKQSRVIRTARGIHRNWIASVLSLLLFLILIFIYVRDYDDNPVILEADGHLIFIKNKSGKILWEKQVADWVNNIESLKKAALIIDVNNDGKNEVLITSEIFDDIKKSYKNFRIACYDCYGILVWQYHFHDKVASLREDLNIYYNYSYIIGVTDINKQKLIYLSTRNSDSFASAIYSLEAKTGKRVGNTLWNSGYIGDGLIYDLDKDSKQELIYTFANNGLKRTGIAVITIDKVDGQGTTSKEYSLFDKNVAAFNAYILVPNTDYNVYIKAFQNGFALNSLRIREDEKKIYFNSVEGLGEFILSLTYKLSFDLKSIDMYSQSDFTAYRDALVREGKLEPPFTDTKEYYQLLKDQVLFWNGNKFVSYAKNMVINR